MTLRQLQKLLEQGDKRLYQKTIQKLIHRIARRYYNMSFEDLISYLRSFDAAPKTGISSERMIAAEKRPIGPKESSAKAPTVAAMKSQGLLYILN
jgi:hypothetical protein